jgi:hypothetical protein
MRHPSPVEANGLIDHITIETLAGDIAKGARP